MGQSHSKQSNQVGRDSAVSESPNENLPESRTVLDQFTQEEDDYCPHTFSVRLPDPKSGKLCARLRFRRPLTEDRLKLFKHRPASLVGAVRVYLDRPDPKLSDIQKEAIRKWNEIDILNIANQFHLVPVQKILEKYFQIFDDLFFGGKLEHHVVLVISRSQFPRLPGCKGHTSEESDPVYKRSRNDVIQCRFYPRSTITIFVSEEHEPISGEAFKKLFGILVHEMCHAFFHIYKCVGRCCNSGSLEQLGTHGHGVMFQEMAFNIRMFAQSKTILGFKLDLGRYCSLLHELHDKPDWKEQMKVSRWGFDEEKLMNDLVDFSPFSRS